jgi:hypothetical protein
MPYKTEGEINAANEGTLYPVLVTVHLGRVCQFVDILKNEEQGVNAEQMLCINCRFCRERKANKIPGANT